MTVRSPRLIAVVSVVITGVIAVFTSIATSQRSPDVPSAPLPAAWPDATSTGVPAGTILRESGSIVVTEPGAVIDGVLVRGSITVMAPDVVISRTRVLGGVIRTGDDSGSPLRTLIVDVEIDGRGLPDAARQAGVGFGGFTVRRSNIHHVGIGVNAAFDAVVEDSWIHDLVVDGDPASGGTHNDGILSNGGSRMRFVGNRITLDTRPNISGAICLYGDFSPITDVTVQGNLLSGGGYALYAGSVQGKPYPRARRVRVIDNRFSLGESGRSGSYGPVVGWRSSGGNEWRGNAWLENGQPVVP